MRQMLFVTESLKNDKVFYYYELQELAKKYSITFVSLDKCDKDELGINNVSCIHYEKRADKLEKCLYAIKYFLDTNCKNEIRDILKKKESVKRKIFQFFRSIEFYSEAKLFEKYIRDNNLLPKDDGDVIYTYWMSFYAFALAMCKDRTSNIRYITRLHGFDLYDEQNDAGRQPFRELINDKFDSLIFAAKNPMDYYLKNHNPDANKCHLCRLGSKELKIRSKIKHDRFLLVSCSNCVPVKRIELIISALDLIDEPLEWIHFGAGSEYSTLREYAELVLKKHEKLVINMMGERDNEEVRYFYETNKADCFISTSASEGGCPLSIQEAMSSGMPIIGTDVGDVADMIGDCGILLSESPSLNEIVSAIKTVMEYDDKMRDSISEKVCHRWSEMFDVDKNKTLVPSLLDRMG